MSDPPPEPEIPVAVTTPTRAAGWLWLLPLIAAAVTAWLLIAHFSEQGVPLILRFEEGHGLKAGDAVKYRGVEVGTVESIGLDPTLRNVMVETRLLPSAEPLARSGSRFWIVRPQLDFTGPRGLDTVIGPNYIAVAPGEGDPVGMLDGQAEPPRHALGGDRALEILLRSPTADRLSPGAPVTYLAVRVGMVIDVGLTADNQGVEARARIDPAHRERILQGTAFWKSGQPQFSLEWFSGVELNLGSLSSLILGGVSLDTPPDQAGPPARDGQVFRLYDNEEEAKSDWPASKKSFIPAFFRDRGDPPEPSAE